jgi:hypothetical protein
MSTLLKMNRIGRNQPCVCDSGKKSKHCCDTQPTYQFVNNEKNSEVSENTTVKE